MELCAKTCIPSKIVNIICAYAFFFNPSKTTYHHMKNRKKGNTHRTRSRLPSNRETIRKRKMKRREMDNKKEKFRKSKEWKEFRAKMVIKANHRDFITGKKLVKGFNVHHMRTNLTEETYCDISHEDEFIPLNSQCHKLLHYLFTYYQKDKSILDRLKEILDKMLELSPNHIDAIDQKTMEECLEISEEKINKDECSVSDMGCCQEDSKPSSTTNINVQSTS